MYWGHNSRPPFQIDANFGFTASVLEMLVFSKPGMIKLLPALPVSWRAGTLTGVLCRGGVTVSLHWDMDKQRMNATLLAKTTQAVTMKFHTVFTDMQCDGGCGAICDSQYGPEYKMISLNANEHVSLMASW
jgi:alpha-L-fucosidase 2